MDPPLFNVKCYKWLYGAIQLLKNSEKPLMGEDDSSSAIVLKQFRGHSDCKRVGFQAEVRFSAECQPNRLISRTISCIYYTKDKNFVSDKNFDCVNAKVNESVANFYRCFKRSHYHHRVDAQNDFSLRNFVSCVYIDEILM